MGQDDQNFRKWGGGSLYAKVKIFFRKFEWFYTPYLSVFHPKRI